MVFPWSQSSAPIIQQPVPTIWMLGRTQSGKSSIVRALTGCTDAVIGSGFTPCTRATRSFDFPPGTKPAMRFLDTRGIDEPNYDPTEDIAACNPQAHMLVVVAKVLDTAQHRVIEIVDKIRSHQPKRPILFVMTCLHEAYAGIQHPLPYPFASPSPWLAANPAFGPLNKAAQQQIEMMGERATRAVMVDFTHAEDGYEPILYGFEAMRDSIIELLPATLGQGVADWIGIDQTAVDSVIKRHAYLAAAAGGVPLPGADIVGVTAVQAAMIRELAQLLKVPQDASGFTRMVAPVVLATIGRRAAASLIKLIPGIGSFLGALSGAAINGISTVALGHLYVWYGRRLIRGLSPNSEEIAEEYRKRFAEAARHWTGGAP
ncbi:MAG: GTPase family protein [Planctomycetota bacterium]